MFNDDVFSFIALIVGIAALIAYIGRRSKRGLKTTGQALKLKKLPRAEESLTPALSSVLSQSVHNAPDDRPRYQTIEQLVERAESNTSASVRSATSRFGTPAKLRDAMIAMTVIGPCRALAPYQEHE